MKAVWIALLAVVALLGMGAGAMWWSEAKRVAALEDELTEAHAANAKLRNDAVAANQKTEALEAESTQLRAARSLSSGRLEPAAEATPAEDEGAPKPQGGFLAQMFKDPQMRKLLAAQQATALQGLYADYLAEAQLTPEQAERFFQLLEERQMALMDSSANAMTGGQVDMKEAVAANDAAEEALQDMLGPERYSEYQDFEKTLGVRIQVQQLNQQLSGEGIPLQESQRKALIQLMSEAGAAMPGFSEGEPQQAASMSPVAIDQYAQAVEAADERIYKRAISVLTPPQLTAFAAFQRNAATAQVAGLKMAQQMSNGRQ